MRANYEKFFSVLAETHKATTVTALFRTVDYCDDYATMRARVCALAERVERDLAKRGHTWKIERSTAKNGQLFYRLVRRQQFTKAA